MGDIAWIFTQLKDKGIYPAMMKRFMIHRTVDVLLRVSKFKGSNPYVDLCSTPPFLELLPLHKETHRIIAIDETPTPLYQGKSE